MSSARAEAVPQRLDLLGAIEGHYAAELLSALRSLGILEMLERPRKASEIAREAAVDPAILEVVLDFLSRTTALIERNRQGAYALSAPTSVELVFQLGKFIDAYAPAVRALGATLKDRGDAAAQVDQRALASAYARVPFRRSPLTLAHLESAGVRCLLDLGCGVASLLIDLVAESPDMAGIGVDASAFMCRIARKRVRDARLSGRIAIHQADGRNAASVLERSEQRRIDGLHGASFLNAFAAGDGESLIAVLRGLRRQFRGRTAWFVDYYGVLGSGRRATGRRLAVLQDLAQSVSGQGVPPRNSSAWEALYRKAGCRLIEVADFSSDDIRWFMHTVRL